MKILIAGYGFVGKAQEIVLKDYHEVAIYDPYLGYDNEWLNLDAIIVCVSTPPNADGSCDVSNVIDIVNRAPNVPILIKSTISVEGWDQIRQQSNNKQVCFSPEFLRQATWEQDAFFKNMFIGGKGTGFWSDLYIGALGDINITVGEPENLVAAKAFRNSFLATKVSFFYQIFDYCDAHNLNYSEVAHAVCSDERIGFSHTNITNERGFGGHCFSKDTSAVTRSAQLAGTRLTIIEDAINYNKSIRKDNV